MGFAGGLLRFPGFRYADGQAAGFEGLGFGSYTSLPDTGTFATCVLIAVVITAGTFALE